MLLLGYFFLIKENTSITAYLVTNTHNSNKGAKGHTIIKSNDYRNTTDYINFFFFFFFFFFLNFSKFSEKRCTILLRKFPSSNIPIINIHLQTHTHTYTHTYTHTHTDTHRQTAGKI